MVPRVTISITGPPLLVGFRAQLQCERSATYDFLVVKPATIQGSAVERGRLDVTRAWAIVPRYDREDLVFAVNGIYAYGYLVKKGCEDFVTSVAGTCLMQSRSGKDIPR